MHRIGPGLAHGTTGKEDLYRSCLRGAEIIECLERAHGWTQIVGKGVGPLVPGTEVCCPTLR